MQENYPAKTKEFPGRRGIDKRAYQKIVKNLVYSDRQCHDVRIGEGGEPSARIAPVSLGPILI